MLNDQRISPLAELELPTTDNDSSQLGTVSKPLFPQFFDAYISHFFDVPALHLFLWLLGFGMLRVPPTLQKFYRWFSSTIFSHFRKTVCLTLGKQFQEGKPTIKTLADPMTAANFPFQIFPSTLLKGHKQIFCFIRSLNFK